MNSISNLADTLHDPGDSLSPGKARIMNGSRDETDEMTGGRFKAFGIIQWKNQTVFMDVRLQ